MRPKILALSTLLLLLVFTAVPFVVSARSPHPLVGKPLPPVTMATVKAAPKPLKPNRKPLAVIFFTTWCKDCAGAVSFGHALARRYGSALDVRLVDIAVTEPGRAAVQGYLARRGVQANVYLDTLGEAADRWNVRAVPALYLIGEDGKLHGVLEGRLSMKAATPAVERLLGGDRVRQTVPWMKQSASSTKP